MDVLSRGAIKMFAIVICLVLLMCTLTIYVVCINSINRIIVIIIAKEHN